MIYRAFLLLITCLWITMWALLIRSELLPESAGIRTVPVEHVLRDAFRREKDSDLWITNAGTPIGSLRLSPKQDEKTGTQTLSFIGRVTLDLPDGSSQRPGWTGELVMNRDWVVQSFHLASMTREFPAGVGSAPAHSMQLEVQLDPPAHKGWYVVRLDKELAEATMSSTLDEEGVSELVAHLGIDQAVLKQLPNWQIASARGDGTAIQLHGAERKAGDLHGDDYAQRANAHGSAGEPVGRGASRRRRSLAGRWIRFNRRNAHDFGSISQ